MLMEAGLENIFSSSFSFDYILMDEDNKEHNQLDYKFIVLVDDQHDLVWHET